MGSLKRVAWLTAGLILDFGAARPADQNARTKVDPGVGATARSPNPWIPPK